MASTAGEGELPAPSFADLPPEVLQQVYRAAWSSYGAFSHLALKDRVRALAVCCGWRAALAGLPIPSLTLRVADGQVVNGWEPPSWPEAAALSLDASACSTLLENKARSALLAVSWVGKLLGTCAGQALQDLKFHVPGAVLPHLLPQPHLALPHLQHLDANISSDNFDPGPWVAGLELLPNLASLRLVCSAGWWSLEAPAAAALTELRMTCGAGIRVDLAGLPALRRLELAGTAGGGGGGGGVVWGGGVAIGQGVEFPIAAGGGPGSVDLWVGSGSAVSGGGGRSPLQQLRCSSQSVLCIDFGLVPALEVLDLSVGRLEGVGAAAGDAAAGAGALERLTQLELAGAPAVAGLLQGEIPGEVLRTLSLRRSRAFADFPELSAPSLLAFPSLRQLDLYGDSPLLSWDSLGISHLTALRSLKLRGLPPGSHAPPGHPTLTRLELDWVQREEVLIDLAMLPALRCLEIPNGCCHVSITSSNAGGSGSSGSMGGSDSAGGSSGSSSSRGSGIRAEGHVGGIAAQTPAQPPSSPLSRIACRVLAVSLDFALTPALQWLQLEGLHTLTGAATLGAATQLRTLCLVLSDPDGAADALRCAPASLRSLALSAHPHCWSQAVGQALKGMAGKLEVLSLEGLDFWERPPDELAALLAGDLPCWRQLRALSLGRCREGGGCSVPEALALASRLTRLQVGTAASQDDLKVLASLPALHHLHLASVPAAEEGELAACVFRAMPHLGSLEINRPMYGAQFLECAEHNV